MIWQIFHLPLKIGTPAVVACREVEVGSFFLNSLVDANFRDEKKKDLSKDKETTYHGFQCGTILWKMAKGLCFS